MSVFTVSKYKIDTESFSLLLTDIVHHSTAAFTHDFKNTDRNSTSATSKTAERKSGIS